MPYVSHQTPPRKAAPSGRRLVTDDEPVALIDIVLTEVLQPDSDFDGLAACTELRVVRPSSG